MIAITSGCIKASNKARSALCDCSAMAGPVIAVRQDTKTNDLARMRHPSVVPLHIGRLCMFQLPSQSVDRSLQKIFVKLLLHAIRSHIKRPFIAERCRSGRTGRSRKPLSLHGFPGFESLSLRHKNPNTTTYENAPHSGAFRVSLVL